MKPAYTDKECHENLLEMAEKIGDLISEFYRNEKQGKYGFIMMDYPNIERLAKDGQPQFKETIQNFIPVKGYSGFLLGVVTILPPLGARVLV